ncbi:MAG: TIGR02147 family protein [Fibrobacter sp.]|nr:TIGR02147 family protein [Fibrobacter sp.]
MVNILDYLDYKEYLKAYYTEQRALRPHFTFQWIAERAGFKNRGFVHSIFNNPKTRLSTTNSIKLLRVIPLTRNEKEYFNFMVAYKQENNETEKLRIREKLEEFRKFVVSDQLKSDKKVFFSKWYHGVIRSIIGMITFKGEYKQLSKWLFPHITPEEAEESVALLERLQIIHRTSDGAYALTTAPNLINGADISQEDRDNSHIGLMLAAKDTLPLHLDGNQVRSMTVGISEKTAEIIRKESLEHLDHIKRLIQNDEGPERVYLIQSIFMPLTKKMSE